VYSPKIKTKIEGFDLLKIAFTEYSSLLTFEVEGIVYEWDRQVLGIFDSSSSSSRVIKISELKTVMLNLPSVIELKIYGVLQVDVEFNVSTGLFGSLEPPNKVVEETVKLETKTITKEVTSRVIEKVEVNQDTLTQFTEKVDISLVSDLFSDEDEDDFDSEPVTDDDDDEDEDDFDSEPVSSEDTVEQLPLPLPAISSEPVTDDDDEDLTISLPIFMGQKDSEGKIVKIPTTILYKDIEPFLLAWLSATGQKVNFLKELETKKYNAITIYRYPSISHEVNQDGNLRKIFHRSENIAEIRSRAGTIIERTGRESVPIYASLVDASIIKVTDSKKRTYLCQTFLKKVDGKWVQGSHKIAYFDPATRHLVYFNKDSNPEQLSPIISDPEIFPDLALWRVSLEHLTLADKSWETSKDLRSFDPLNQKVDVSSANRVQEKFLVSPVHFKGFDHPNLPIKIPKPATITERVEPKPIKIDGSRTNDHELQLRTILGNVPCILTVRKSYQQWQLVALPIKVNPVDLIVYLSDKLASKALLEHIGKQISDLVSTLDKNNQGILGLDKRLSKLIGDIDFAPKARTIKNELVQLEKSNTSINLIISELDQLASSIKSGIKPDKTDVLGATQSIRSILNDSHIKHESSYSDDYYRYHVLGNIKIVETVETEKPTYSMVVLGDERITRRSSIPLVMNWLRRIPQLLQKHFGEDYPTNEEIKAHLMSIYPFYKRRLKEGDKLDKSFVNLEADMIIKTKGRLIIEIYFNGQLQTSQLLSITKPVDGSERQGKIPVNVSSSLGFSLDNLLSFLKCSNGKKDFDLLQSVQKDLNSICQKFVVDNVRLFSRERENKTTQVISTKDLLGFTGNSEGLPQVLKRYRKFITPYTSNSEVEIGKLINLLTLETYDQHDTQALFDAMIKNWKVWAKSESIELGGVSITRKNPGDLLAGIWHKTKGQHGQIVWGAFIDELYLLSNLKIGFRTNEGVLLTPWSLLPTDRKTWEHRIRIQLIDILSLGQLEYIGEVEALIKNAKTKEEGKALRDSIRGSSVEAWLQMDIDSLYSALFKVRPNWKSLVHQNVLSHLSALHDALKVAEKV